MDCAARAYRNFSMPYRMEPTSQNLVETFPFPLSLIMME